MIKYYFVFLVSILLIGCKKDINYTHIYTSQYDLFKEFKPSSTDEKVNGTLSLDINTSQPFRKQTIHGFGACFNELGWTSLNRLSESDRSEIMKELFDPKTGACFNICRMPIGANDFSLDWYSYNETEGDFEMKNFTIERDRKTLIPFILNAKSFNPDLKIWASPWCPPSWMKYNGHYACAFTGEEYDEKYRNGLPKDKVGFEGTDMFIQEPAYLEAYALYFKKFIQAYKKEGISIFSVMPQNEFNSSQIFPSCCWTSRGLTSFIGDYLGSAMKEEGVSVMFGTMERPNTALVDSVLQNEKSAKYIHGVGFQWAGKGAVSEIHKNYPDMLLLQTEQECGDGKNDWKGFLYSWELLKHYMNCGVSIYDYWNISLEKGGISRWGWAQNSLVVVDAETSSYQYSYEYYLMKHISHFVKPGAVYLEAKGNTRETLTFMNPDNSIVVLIMENSDKGKMLDIKVDGKSCTVFIKPNSLNTICLNK